ncbi:MAG: hypothetical protein HKN03_17390 [Acidimicrobiales bacterium]|nr:hypothetical protein [Acidimicrobiales bacterium]
MENRTQVEAAAELAELKNLEMVGFVEAAKDPLWVWPVIGLLAGVFLASFELESPVVSIVATIAYVVGIAVLVGTVVHRRRVQPRVTNMPASLNRLFLFYMLGVAVVAAIIMGLGFGVSFILAGIVAFPLVSVGGIFYHVRWRAAVSELATS